MRRRAAAERGGAAEAPARRAGDVSNLMFPTPSAHSPFPASKEKNRPTVQPSVWTRRHVEFPRREPHVGRERWAARRGAARRVEEGRAGETLPGPSRGGPTPRWTARGMLARPRGPPQGLVVVAVGFPGRRENPPSSGSSPPKGGGTDRSKEKASGGGAPGPRSEQQGTSARGRGGGRRPVGEHRRGSQSRSGVPPATILRARA